MARFKPVSNRMVRIHDSLAQTAEVVWAANVFVIFFVRIDFDAPRTHYLLLLSIGDHFVCDGRWGLCNSGISESKSYLFKFLFLLSSVCGATRDTPLESKELLYFMGAWPKIN